MNANLAEVAVSLSVVGDYFEVVGDYFASVPFRGKVDGVSATAVLTDTKDASASGAATRFAPDRIGASINERVPCRPRRTAASLAPPGTPRRLAP